METTDKSNKLSWQTKLAFGVGEFGNAVIGNIDVFYLSIFLTDVAKLPPILAGSIRLIGGVWDAITDPIVGHLSDRTQSGWGKRLLWMIYGAVPLGIIYFFHWLVPPLSQYLLFGYYLLISLLYNTAYTVVNIPYSALTPELTQDYNERTTLNQYRFSFSIGGSLLALVLAQIIFSNVSNPQIQYITIAGITSVTAIIAPFLCAYGLGKPKEKPEPKPPQEQTFLSQKDLLMMILGNRPFLYVIIIYLFSWLGVQITAVIIPYYVKRWMLLPDAVSAQVGLAVQATALLMLFVWNPISHRVGKKAVYFMGTGLWLIAQSGLFFLQPNQIGLMYGLAVIAGLGVSTAYLIPWSMLPDVIELDELNTGTRREGVFYGLMSFIRKIGIAIGLFLVNLGLQAAGFDGNSSLQPPSALLAIRFSIGPLPTIFLILSLIAAYFYPITREIHADILLKLAERKSNISPSDQ